MRWVSSNSSDVISFYSLSDGVQHVLPCLYGEEAVGNITQAASPDNASGHAQRSSYMRYHQHQQDPEIARRSCGRLSNVSAAISKKESQQSDLVAYQYNFVEDSGIASLTDPEKHGSLSATHWSSSSGESEMHARYGHTNSGESCHRSVIRRQPSSLGYITTCIFSGGWGGYDETEVTVGTTEGYVYALPALWPVPSATIRGSDGCRRRERNAPSACMRCRFPTVSDDDSNPCAHAGTAAAYRNAGRADGEGQRNNKEEEEETSSVPFPASYVAAPVKRFLRLPYTIQHLHMLGAHTPTLAGDYHEELLWLQRQLYPHRREESTKTSGFVSANASASVVTGECRRDLTRRNNCSCEWCGDTNNCVSCTSCCCLNKPLLSLYSEKSLSDPCGSHAYTRFSGVTSAAHTSGTPATAVSGDTGPNSRHFAHRVQQFFSTDRLLLALDKGGNGVVAHWPAPPYLQESSTESFNIPRLKSSQRSSHRRGPGYSPTTLTTTVTISDFDAGDAEAQGVDVSEMVAAASPPATVTPILASSFCLNLSVHCCETNPIVTPLLAVVPSVAAAGGLRLLSVYDLVTTTFVFYARPPANYSLSLLKIDQHQAHRTQAVESQQQRHRHQDASTEKAFWRPSCSQPRPGEGRVWSNICCLSYPLRNIPAHVFPSGARPTSGAAAMSRSPASIGSGNSSSASGARAIRNMPISISSLTWLPALHPLLLGASTDSGLLLLYDLRASPHPVFCASRSLSARASPSGHTREKDASAHTCINPYRENADVLTKPYTAVHDARLHGDISAGRPSKFAPTAGMLSATAASVSSNTAWLTEVSSERGKFIDHLADAGRSKNKEREQPRENECRTRQMYRSSSPCGKGKNKRTCFADWRITGKAGRHQPVSLTFITTPAWLTSAATSHDAAILPCGCPCCRARTASFSNIESWKVSAQCAANTSKTPCFAEGHQQEGTHDCPADHGVSLAWHSYCSDGSLQDKYRFTGAARTQEQKPKSGDVVRRRTTGLNRASLFGGCAASVVMKPRNGSRPRPQVRRRSRLKCRRSFPESSRKSAAPVTATSSHLSDKPTHVHGSSEEFPSDVKYCKESSSLVDLKTTPACADVSVVDRRKRRQVRRNRQVITWRNRWFREQEKALVSFFDEACLVLRSKGSRKDSSSNARLIDRVVPTSLQPEHPPSCTNSCQQCDTHTHVRYPTAHAPFDRSDSKSVEPTGKRQKRNDHQVADSESSTNHSCSHAPLVVSCETNSHIKKGNVGRASRVACCALTVDPSRSCIPASSSATGSAEVVSSVQVVRPDVSAGLDPSHEVFFHLLQLASSPCSIFSGFPFAACSEQATSTSLCSPLTEASLCLRDMTAAFMASSFFPLLAKLLFSHRLDQHEVARKLAYHQLRLLLKLLHAIDCTERATIARGPPAVDTAVLAVIAAQSASSEAVAARAAGVENAVPGSANAKASTGTQQREVARTGVSADHPSHACVAGKRKFRQATAQGELRKNGWPETSASESTLVSPFLCSSSSKSSPLITQTLETSETSFTPETATSLLAFGEKVLSMYADILLNNRKSCAGSCTADSEESSVKSSIRDMVKTLLPDLFKRHTHNCVQLLRYAADVIYAFGDGAPVLMQKSAAAARAVQAAAACAAGLETHLYLSCMSAPGSAYSATVGADDLFNARLSRTSCAGTREEQETTSPDPDEVAMILNNDEQKDGSHRQFRCGCGRVEAAVKAKARRWLVNEFMTETLLAPGTSLSKSTCFLRPLRKKRSTHFPREEKKFPCREMECGRAKKLREDAQLIATALAVASSICLCDLFQSETFFPVLFFNTFSRLCDGITQTPFCIQRNCIRSLPLSDAAYQKLAQAQLRLLTRKRCRSRRRVIGASLPGRQDQYSEGTPVSGLSHWGPPETAKGTCQTSSPYFYKSVCCGPFEGDAWPSHAASAEALYTHDRLPDRWAGRLNLRQTRKQQLLCLDESGRVYVLTVSLRMLSENLTARGCGVQHGAGPVNSITRRHPNLGRTAEGRVAAPLHQKQGKRCAAAGSSCYQSKRLGIHGMANNSGGAQLEGSDEPHKHGTGCLAGGFRTQMHDRVVSSSEWLAGCSDAAAEGHKVTVRGGLEQCSGQPSHVETASLQQCRGVRKHMFWGSGEISKLLHLEEKEQKPLNFSDQKCTSCVGHHLPRKMWKERWLNRKRRHEWCAACMRVEESALSSTSLTCENTSLANMGKGEIATGAEEMIRTAVMGASCSLKRQERLHAGSADAVTAKEISDPTFSQAAKKARTGRGRIPGASQGMRTLEKGVKRPARFVDEDESAGAEHVAGTAAAARLAQIAANTSLLRLYPLLPLWKACSRPHALERFSRKLRTDSFPHICKAFISRGMGTQSHIDYTIAPQKDDDRPTHEQQGEEPYNVQSRIPTRAPNTINKSEVCDTAGTAPDGGLVAPVSCTGPPLEKEYRKRALRIASVRYTSDGSAEEQSEEGRADCGCCRLVCCRLQVEEDASFEINGKSCRGHRKGDSCRSRVVSLAIHENSRYILAATCAPSFLLYSSSRVDSLPSNEYKDRLLFGCATGTIPQSRPFRLISAFACASFSSAASAHTAHPGTPTIRLPSAPLGPRPPPPMLISASPILPPAAAAPFIPRTLLKRHVDRDVAYGLFSDSSLPKPSLTRGRSEMSFHRRKHTVHVDYGAGVRRYRDTGQTAFSDWLTDEEDEKEMHGGASESETGSASDD